MESTGIGIVEPRDFTFGQNDDGLSLESGRTLAPVTMRYETYGALDADKSNAILILHAFSGDAHAAGYHRPDDKHPGWWDAMIGPGRGIDTNRYFVICTNVLGSCKGSTGPGSIHPRTGRPYAMQFPVITIRDMVRVQALVLDRLGIERLLCVAGGSMGGMQALEWAVRYPTRVRSAIPISTTGASSPLSIGFNKIGRRAIMADPNWRGGDYYGGEPPRDGLAVARMIGHLTFMSDASMRRKFGRRISGREGIYAFTAQYDVERYLHYNGYKFPDRFDANSYLYLTKALDTFDLGDGCAGGMEEALAQIRGRIRFITFTSDWLYPPVDTDLMEVLLRRLGKRVEHLRVESDYGHDAFLVEVDRYANRIAEFLERVRAEVD
ncbi:MAG: homoserine O-acetyltransferase [Proteobacteria bacterium]|nr:homoserine O-acetyltransferase [Pseudomonadota bacterium]